jgi:hypothetical protein
LRRGHSRIDKLHDMFSAVVWVLDKVVIRATLGPWAILGEEDPISSFHQFVFEEDDTSLIGPGLPTTMRDSQLGVCAATRMVLDNGRRGVRPNVEVNEALLEPATPTRRASTRTRCGSATTSRPPRWRTRPCARSVRQPHR